MATVSGSLTFLTDLEVVNNVSSSGDVDVLRSINGYRVDDILANITNVWVNRTTNHVLIIEGNVHCESPVTNFRLSAKKSVQKLYNKHSARKPHVSDVCVLSKLSQSVIAL